MVRRRTRWRWAAGGGLVGLAHRLEGRYASYIPLECPPSATSRPRWGHGRASHPRLDSYLAGHVDDYRRSIAAVAESVPDLLRIPRSSGEPGVPQWDQGFLPVFDAAVLYGLVRSTRPRQYLEVGSGNSTLFVARARRDGQLATKIVSVDPAPRADVDHLCDHLIRRPLESTDLAQFSALEAGDMLFVDDSHRVFMNSDVVTFFLDALALIGPGVLVGIHDIFLPDDYPLDWAGYFLSEQYLLAAYILGGAARIKPVLASWYCSNRPELRQPLDGLLTAREIQGLETRGWSFWFVTG
ncbi:MAG TPA: class I SAM-dependent methyltransferase [Acidimicrobiales bacterium]|nr:class I SAM-dependent methyltransferase [Acidimicrobiales bacterium]